MSTERAVWLTCDNCGASTKLPDGAATPMPETRQEAAVRARRVGWAVSTRKRGLLGRRTRGPTVDLCSSCRARPRLPLDLG